MIPVAGALLGLRRALRFWRHATAGFVSSVAADVTRRKASCNGQFRLLTSAAIPLMVATFLLSGCARYDSPADLVIVNGAEPGSIDPATSTGLEELRITMALFEGLMRVDPKDARPIPGLADRYERSPDGKVYTFHIRTNAV